MKETVKVYGLNGKVEYREIEIPEEPVSKEPEPTQLDILEAQVTYTAMMTDTLLGG